MAEVFNESFALQYDAFSGGIPRTFEFAAGNLAKICPDIKPGEKGLEVGSGTGNSAIVLKEKLPQLEQLTGIEPSKEMLQLALYKFGKIALSFPEQSQLPPDMYQDALDYIKEQQERARPFRDKVSFIEASGHSIPIATRSIDRVYYTESFHWLAINKSNQVDFNLLSEAIAEIRRILKPGGKLLFDSNGHLFKFGNEEMEGRKIDDIHFTKHPFRARFNEAFSRIASDAGFDVPVSNQEVSPLHYMFDQQKICSALEQNGFRLMPASEGKDYVFKPLPFTLSDLTRASVTSAKMGHFRKPELAELPEAEKNRWITESIQNALRKTPEDSGSYYETFVFFAAQKI